jgi:hypothetical protein
MHQRSTPSTSAYPHYLPLYQFWVRLRANHTSQKSPMDQVPLQVGPCCPIEPRVEDELQILELESEGTAVVHPGTGPMVL